MGLNNIELITDRPLDVNLKEIRACKRKYPKHVLIISLMVESKREAWQEIAKKVEDTGADGFELNFGCPHGMSERGMGAAMGQVPEYTCMVTEWVKEASNLPVIVKLTPNITNINYPARAAVKGKADALSLINTINSVIGVDLDTMIPYPNVNGKAAHGGYCGPAVKPIALNMVSELARDAEVNGKPPRIMPLREDEMSDEAMDYCKRLRAVSRPSWSPSIGNALKVRLKSKRPRLSYRHRPKWVSSD